MDMIMQILNGFCMALADSVPGVSGGTIAFLLGFYDKFINSLDRLMFGKLLNLESAGYLALYQQFLYSQEYLKVIFMQSVLCLSDLLSLQFRLLSGKKRKALGRTRSICFLY